MKLSEYELDKVRQLIYDQTGMFFDKKKDYFLLSRVEQRANHLHIRSFQEYLDLLFLNRSEREVQSFIESITINETYFFRDFPQLQGFAEHVLQDYIASQRRIFRKRLKIWSAACSTGEEPYTLAIILREAIEDYNDWNISVDATDIDNQVIQYAQRGIYSDRSMKDTPHLYRRKYFDELGQGWQLKDNIRRQVQFESLNLIDKTGMRDRRDYDFIFCRNVLIYFDDVSRKNVVNSLYDSLSPGGYLFLGHSESIGRITAAFELQKSGDFLCYRKPLLKKVS